jgi:hypothetical protein
VVHTGGGRRRGKSRPRILYWFRTPPGIRIGRSALDEAAIRLIEEHNPDVEFDWTRILKGQDAPVDEKPAQQDRWGKQRPREFSQQRPLPPRGPGPDTRPQGIDRSNEPASASAEPPSARVDEPLERPGEVAEHVGELAEFVTEPAERVSEDERVDDPTSESAGQPVDLPSQRVDEAAIDELLSDSPAGPQMEVAENPPTTAAQARLGSEGLSRLRARHSEVLARISETVTDPVRRDELKSQAERLNPDTWVTDAEVSEGLEAYETVFESLRTVVGRRRRRRRRSGGRSTEGGPTGSAQETSSPDMAGGEEADTEDTGEEQ